MRVVHRYAAEGLYTPPGAVALLIGTFPSVLVREAFGRLRATDTDFFYGSIDNNFWPDLAALYNRSFRFDQSDEAVVQRKILLDDLKLATTDVIFSCETTGSATDTALQQIELNEGIVKTLDENPSISTLYFTSGSGKINAESLTLRLLKETGRSSSTKLMQKTAPRLRALIYTTGVGNRRPMRAVTLYSPSPLAEQWGGVTREKRRAQYAQFLPPLRP